MTFEEARYWHAMCRQAMLGVNSDYCRFAGRPAPDYVIVIYDKTHTPIDVLATIQDARRYIDQCHSTRWQRRFSMHGVSKHFSRDT